MCKLLVGLVLIIALVGCGRIEHFKNEREFRRNKKTKDCEVIYSELFGVTVECHVSKEDVSEIREEIRKFE